MEPWYKNDPDHKRELELIKQERLEDEREEIQAKNLQRLYYQKKKRILER
jgi:hypothetical protein